MCCSLQIRKKKHYFEFWELYAATEQQKIIKNTINIEEMYVYIRIFVFLWIDISLNIEKDVDMYDIII